MIVLETKTRDDEVADKRRAYLFTRLLVSVLEVVQFCGSLPNHDNTEECRTLLVELLFLCVNIHFIYCYVQELMETHVGNPWVVLHVCTLHSTCFD